MKSLQPPLAQMHLHKYKGARGPFGGDPLVQQSVTIPSNLLLMNLARH